jgi:hypothetical protein
MGFWIEAISSMVLPESSAKTAAMNTYKPSVEATDNNLLLYKNV